VLLISDGIETCDVDPCELVQSWRDDNIDIRVHVVGLGLTDLSRSAMQCIAEASGTKYLDANSAGELNNGIKTVTQSEPVLQLQPQKMSLEFKILGEDEEGSFVPVLGTITHQNMQAQQIASNNRYVFEGGHYSITVGVPTVNNIIYQPVIQDVEINSSGLTKVVMQLQ
jgi:hypothetical protein